MIALDWDRRTGQAPARARLIARLSESAPFRGWTGDIARGERPILAGVTGALGSLVAVALANAMKVPVLLVVAGEEEARAVEDDFGLLLSSRGSRRLPSEPHQEGARASMAQRYLAQIADGDKRVLIIGGEVVPFALARIPKAGETRGNLAAGGRGVAMPLTAREREIAEFLAPILWTRGLVVVGLDLIGGHHTEINVTSPTCMVEIATQQGFDVAGLVIDTLERACG